MSLVIQDVMTSYMDTYSPTSNENSVFNNILPFYYWINTTTGDIFLSTSQDNTNITWRTLITSMNIMSYINQAGWNLDTARSSSNGLLSFGSSRTPNTNVDTFVTVSISQTSTLLVPASVLVQLNYGGGMVNHAQLQLSGIAATQIQPCTFLVPKGSSYQFVSSSGTNSIVYCKETYL